MRRITIVLTLGFLVGVVPALAQMTEVSLDLRIDDAVLVVEARVMESTPFWNPDRTRILTGHRLEILKVLKLSGRRLDEVEEIRLLTLGGRIDDRKQEVNPSLSLSPGDTGLFFLEQRKVFAGLSDAWLPVGGPQGFVRYDPFDGEARDPFHTYPDLQKDLFEPIRVRTGQPVSVIKSIDPPETTLRGVNPVITGFNPTTVSGGVQEVLTIDGSNFGTFTGSATILFDDPDDGAGGNFSSIAAVHVVSWSNSQIQVLVPAAAGTGSFLVFDSTGASGVSPSPVTIDYSISEQIDVELERIFHEDEDGRGGFTFVYSTSTANNGVDFTSIADAVSRFEESLEEWRCAVGWATEVDGTTTVTTVAQDGVNMVTFDNDVDALGAGVLGLATSHYTGCSLPPDFPKQWHNTGIDIAFHRDGTDGINWFFGADTAGQMPGEFDFKSIALHEIGHAVQHRHVNNGGDFMFFAIAPGANSRTLSAANIAGGQDIVAYSDGRMSVCALGMRPFNCSNAPTARFLAVPTATCGTTLDVDFTDLSYDGPTSWIWTFFDTFSSTARNPSHTYNGLGTYSLSLDVTNSNGSDSVTVANAIILTTAPAGTCANAFTNYEDCCSIGPIFVSLNTINYFSLTNTQGDPMYEDLTCSQATVLEPGMTYPISVITAGANPEVVQVYIDWNNDGTLAAGELVLDSPTGMTTHNGMVTVPMAPVLDTALRMRVLSDFVAAPISGPCEDIGFGQVEDYSVIVAGAAAAGPGRIPDTSLRITKGAPPTIFLTWDASCGPDAMDFSIYQGNLGVWDSHTQKVCSTNGNMFRTVGPGNPSRYYLVVPVSATDEGSYGLDSMNIERPVGVSTCTVTQDLTACP